MFDVLSCFEGSVNCNWKWFYQKYFPSRSSVQKIFSLAELFIFRNIMNWNSNKQNSSPHFSIDSVYFGMCLYSPVPAWALWHTNLIKTKTFQGGRISWINEGQWAIKEGWNKIILKPQRSIILGRADMRVSQLQLGGGRRLVILETADIEHHWDRDVTNTNPAM